MLSAKLALQPSRRLAEMLLLHRALLDFLWKLSNKAYVLAVLTALISSISTPLSILLAIFATGSHGSWLMYNGPRSQFETIG